MKASNLKDLLTDWSTYNDQLNTFQEFVKENYSLEDVANTVLKRAQWLSKETWLAIVPVLVQILPQVTEPIEFWVEGQRVTMTVYTAFQRSFLTAALYSCDLELLELYLKHGFSFNIVKNPFSKLDAADPQLSITTLEKVIKLMRDNSVDINQTNIHDETPIFEAVSFYPRLVPVYLQNGADPLHIVKGYDCETSLLDHAIRVSKRTKSNKTVRLIMNHYSWPLIRLLCIARLKDPSSLWASNYLPKDMFQLLLKQIYSDIYQYLLSTDR
jgi:hypothetical protein